MVTTDSHGRRCLLAEHANTSTHTAVWRYEEPETGETYLIECICGHWQVFRDVWNAVTEDWDGARLAVTVDAFLKQHNIDTLVS